MRLAFDVGVHERHRVEFSFSKAWGWLTISVDGQRVRSDLHIASIQLVQTFDLVVGVQERHAVRIEKHRERMFGGFRPQPVYAYVDGRLVAQGVA
ncbi:hypothetical protein [Cryptosporangium minutisporangium]|uniref:Uncharacterized protein n=1 Tax=Cryptosporangium minutisporangium TaxID=113569 RepID=A0ABP6TBT4_9ACTN